MGISTLRNLALTLTLTLGAFAANAQVFWTETFGNSGVNCAGQLTSANGFVSANGTWTMTNTGTNNAKANTWYISSTEAGMGAGNCGDGCLNTSSLTNRSLHLGNISTSTSAIFFCPTGDCGAAYDASTNAEITDKRAESPTINCSGKSTITLGFNYMENGQNTLDDATVYYFDGSSWALLVNTPKSNNSGCLGQGRWTAYTFALPASANNNANVKIGFRWVNNGDGLGSDPSFAVDDITLSTPAAAPQANFTASKTSLCVGDCINFTDLSTNSPTTWSWTFQGGTPGTSIAQNPTNVCYNTAGTYSVTLTATNTNGSSTTSKTTYIIVNSSANLTAGSTNATCGNNNGTASVTATAGNTPYTYLWSNGQATATATGLSAGTYTVTVTTTNGCTKTTTVSVSSTGSPNVSLTSSTNILCNGAATGSAAMSASAGTTPYTYSWNTGQTTFNATGLSAGTYTLIVAGSNGCTKSQTVNITQPGAINLGTSANPTNCGSSTGSATATSSGGTGSISYSWSPGGATTATITNLSAGTYTVTAQDGNGCTKTAIASVNSSTGPTLTLTTSGNVLCNGGSTGSANMSSSSGTSPYTYSWSNGQTSATATGLSAGTYTLTVQDANGCQSTKTVSITQPTQLAAAVGSSSTICSGNTGTTSVTASGGTGTFTYSWNPGGQTTATATGLGAGSYTITVTDNNGCTKTANVSVTSAGSMTVNLTSSTNPVCNGQSTGIAAMSAATGTAPYTYSWSGGGGTNASATGLSAGTYTITVTDANGCQNTQTVSITQPSAITATAAATAANCGQTDGSASVTASGGTGTLTYAWSNGGTTSSITGLSAGNYTLTLTDGNGCTSTAQASVGQNGGPTANAGSSVTITLGASTILNGNGGGTYTWTPSTGLSCTNCQNPIATPSVTTTYTLIVTDVNGCTDADTVTVIVDIPCNSGELYIPNAFSPNADLHNDLFVISGGCIKVYDLKIYDRWGEKVFESDDITKSWDGTFHGKAFTSAVFVYHLNIVKMDDTIVEKKGNVTLIK